MGGATMPSWPRALSQPLAAAYTGLSEGSFRAHVMKEVPPVRLSKKRIAWLREDLDAWLDRKAGKDPAETTGRPGPSLADLWDRALDGAA